MYMSIYLPICLLKHLRVEAIFGTHAAQHVDCGLAGSRAQLDAAFFRPIGGMGRKDRMRRLHYRMARIKRLALEHVEPRSPQCVIFERASKRNRVDNRPA